MLRKTVIALYFGDKLSGDVNAAVTDLHSSYGVLTEGSGYFHRLI